jgi:hypothetical protein
MVIAEMAIVIGTTMKFRTAIQAGSQRYLLLLVTVNNMGFMLIISLGIPFGTGSGLARLTAFIIRCLIYFKSEIDRTCGRYFIVFSFGNIPVKALSVVANTARHAMSFQLPRRIYLVLRSQRGFYGNALFISFRLGGIKELVLISLYRPLLSSKTTQDCTQFILFSILIDLRRMKCE